MNCKKLISPVMVSLDTAQVHLFVTCMFASVSVPNTFMFDCAEKQSDPKTCQETDTSKPGFSATCCEGQKFPSSSNTINTQTYVLPS